MRMDSAHGFVTHHSFTFLCTNMLLRHAALNTGNVFAKRCAQYLSVAELKRTLLEGDEKVLNKLFYFAAPIPATRQNLRYKTHQAVSFTRWLRLSSDDKAMFNCFQKFSAADIHCDELHMLLLPGSERYILKTVVKDMEGLSFLSEQFGYTGWIFWISWSPSMSIYLIFISFLFIYLSIIEPREVRLRNSRRRLWYSNEAVICRMIHIIPWSM